MSDTPNTAVVWAEIPVSNLDAGKKFYENVLATKLNEMEMGPNKVAVLPYGDGSASANLYEGETGVPGKGNTIHLKLPDAVEAGMDRVVKAGGQVVSDIVSIPTGRFAYCIDPDGNSIGIFSD